MKHLGDITKINGAEIEPVWCITGGSPCQDLSVAGKRAGLAGARSGLFMEQVRVVKEMRDNDKRTGRSGELVRPRFMVWENVPGAFSSNGGEDFRAVLEEIVRIVEPEFSIPRLPQKQKWTKAGAILGDGWSVAWRTHDAQFWGVPQRRRRIALVADFGGQCAAEVLFERKSVSRYSEQSEQTREEAAGDSGNGVAVDDRMADHGAKGNLICLNPQDYQTKRCYSSDGVFPALTAGETSGQDQKSVLTVAIEGNGQRESHFGDGYKQTDKMYTLNTTEVHGVAYGIGRYAFNQGQNAQYKPSICEEIQPTIVARGAGAVAHTLDCRNGKVNEEISGTLQAKETGGFSYNCVNPVAYAMQAIGEHKESEQASSCKMRNYKGATDLICEKKCYGISAYESNAMKSGNPKSGIYEAGTSRTLDLNGGNPGCNQGGVAVCEKHVYENHSQDARYVPLGDVSETVSQKYGTGGNNQPLVAERFIRWIVRRLTPLECERLQGYPDFWTDLGDWTDSKGKNHKAADTPRYKALGNSIALPFWYWLFKQMEKYLPEDATLGSLFDGIGGFPLCWEQIHGKGTARWASEIEEFPIAVTKYRFGED